MILFVNGNFVFFSVFEIKIYNLLLRSLFIRISVTWANIGIWDHLKWTFLFPLLNPCTQIIENGLTKSDPSDFKQSNAEFLIFIAGGTSITYLLDISLI